MRKKRSNVGALVTHQNETGGEGITQVRINGHKTECQCAHNRLLQ